MPMRMRVYERESIGLALRRLKRLLERSGLTRELRNHRHYEKPSEVRRHAKCESKTRFAKATFLPIKPVVGDGSLLSKTLSGLLESRR